MEECKRCWCLWSQPNITPNTLTSVGLGAYLPVGKARNTVGLELSQCQFIKTKEWFKSRQSQSPLRKVELCKDGIVEHLRDFSASDGRGCGDAAATPPFYIVCAGCKK